MSPRKQNPRLPERLVASSMLKPEGAINGQATSTRQHQDVFHFVSVNPTSEVQKVHNRTVIRSHASKYIWRQHRAGRAEKISAKKRTVRESVSTLSTLPSSHSRPSRHEPPWPHPDAPAAFDENEPMPSDLSPTEPEVSPSKTPATNGIKFPSVVRKDSSSSSSTLCRQNRKRMYLSPANIAPGIKESPVGGPFNQLTAWLADPFHTYPSMLGESAISKLMRYAVFDLWPGLVLGASNRKWDRQDAADNWLPPAMSSPPLFTAFLYGAAGHMQTRKRLESAQFAPQTREEKLEQIICETETIKQLNKMMHDPSQACSDVVILAVLCMAFNRIDYSGWNVSTDPWPKAPLRNLQWLDVYGGLSLNDHHIKGLLALIEMKGGLSQVKLPGLAETLSTSAVMLSTKYLVKPRLPFVPIFKESAQGQTPRWPTVVNPIALGSLADDGRRDPILKAGLPQDISDILRHMRDYNNVVNLYSQGLLPELEPAVIADRRNWIQYNLVSLSSGCEFHEDFSQAYKTYEACRLSALIYSMLVIFPLPAANRPFQRLSSMMRTALMDSGLSTSWGCASEMLLWSLVLGGLAAKDTPEREWFAGRLRDAIATVGLENWEALKGLLTEVMWMDSVCDMGGQALWMEALQAPGYGLEEES